MQKTVKNKVKSITLGCRFNFYESEVAKSIIDNLEPEDDVIIINTCSVTHEAERQSKQTVRKAIRENKNAKIIVTGCAAKTSADYFENLEGVFKVIQNDKKENIKAYYDIPHSASKINFDEDLIMEDNNLFENRARAFVQIQNGCDHFCSYCIVPFTRGRSRSLPLDKILNRIGHFCDLGFKEIVLSGIDITSYGKGLEEKIELADVIDAILAKFPEMKRLRISSIDPKGVSERLFELFAYGKKIMPHFHLSIQSGDNEVLKAMRRRHTREDVIEFCSKLQDARSDVVFGADFIAGFPSENEAMFQNTIKLIDDAGLSLMHIFPYSPRNGTLAAKMIQIPQNIILKRAKILREKANKAKIELFRKLVGKNISGIIEKNDNNISYGKTDSFVQFITKKQYNASQIVEGLKVVSFDKDYLILE